MASGDSIDTIEVVESSYMKNNAEEHSKIKHTDGEDEEKTKNTTDKVTTQDVVPSDAKTPPSVVRNKSDRERKIGHRRVGVGGEITYKKIQTTQIMGSIQLGIQHAVGGLASKPERDLLMQDFMTVETTNFPSEGSNHTPAHHYSEFKFKNYAPIAFRYFRDLFGIQPDDFLMSMCSAPLRELSNPGASGSIFYLTDDDEFIIKTVQHKEGEFLQKLLPGYYMNLNQNPRTLLPKFFGLYCYQCNSKNVRLVIMNNLLPSSVTLHMKYDLKGSTYKRKASKSERCKKSPTFKDLDFMEHHPEGLFLEADTHSALIKTIQRDCRVLESFKIMDYSLLVGVHNLDQAQREKIEKRSQILEEPLSLDHEAGDSSLDPSQAMMDRERERDDRVGAAALNRSRSINRQRLVAHSTAMESIQAESEPIDEEDDVPPGGIPARNAKGERLLLFIGIIDILQSYRLKKKLEHTWKSMIHDGDTVSVHRPGFYAQRFQDFMAKTVFKKIPSPLKHSPSKRKSLSRPLRHEVDTDSNASPEDHISSKPTSPPAYTTFATAPSTSTPVITSPPPTSYPAVLVGRPTSSLSDIKPKIPPPVPPRGTPKAGRPGQTNGKGAHLLATNGNLLHDLLCLSVNSGSFYSSDLTWNEDSQSEGFNSTFDHSSSLNQSFKSDSGQISARRKPNGSFRRSPRKYPELNIDTILGPPRRDRTAYKRSISLREKYLDECTEKSYGKYRNEHYLNSRPKKYYQKQSVSLDDYTRNIDRSSDESNIEDQKRTKDLGNLKITMEQTHADTSLQPQATDKIKPQVIAVERKETNSTGSESDLSSEGKQNKYGNKVKALKNIFDKSKESHPLTPKIPSDEPIPTYRKPRPNPNFVGTSSYVDNEQRYEKIPRIIISPTTTYDSLTYPLSPERNYGCEVYNSKQAQKPKVFHSRDLGDLV